MRVLFYARPWSVPLQLAIEERWRADGHAVEARYITHQLQSETQLRRAGRDVVRIGTVVDAMDVPDPRPVLERIEREHESLLPLMRYLMSERYFQTRPREWQLQQLARHALFFEAQLRDGRFDLLVGEAPDLMASWLAYGMAPSYGCRVVGLMPSTIPAGRLLTLRDHREIPGAREAFAQLRARELTPSELAAARALQATVNGEGTKLDYLPPRRRVRDFATRVLNGTVLRIHLGGSLWQWRERRAGNWFVQPDPTVERLIQPFRGLRARWADRRYLTDRLSGRPFAFFPIHYEPEATTLVHGSYFGNQLEVIRNLARSMPAAWDLVVKEHFYMRGRRELEFYRELRRIPNLRVLPFSHPTNQLIQQAEVVAVISSTAGLEAGLIGQPVVMFGEYPWEYAPTITKVGALGDLPSLLRQAPATRLGPDHHDVLAFGASWDAALPPGLYYINRAYDWLEPANVALLADALRERASAQAGDGVGEG